MSVESTASDAENMTSSTPFVNPNADIPSAFESWVRDLDAVQKASKRKEAEITNTDPSILIANELARHGITVNTSVEYALELMEDKQQLGETIEISVVMEKLPQQWSTYRIALQQNARDYFRQHLTEAPDFMEQYFRSITFFTLWNDVWMRYVETAGGKELAILRDVQVRLREAEKPGPKAAFLLERASLRKNVEETFPFNKEELAQVCVQGVTAIDNQIAIQRKTITQLDAQLKITLERHAWVRSKIADTEKTLKVTEEIDPTIVEDETTQLTGVKVAVSRWCKLFYSHPLVLHSRHLLKEMLKANAKVRDNFDLAFEQVFSGDEGKVWEEAYEAYVRAELNQIQAAQLRDFIERTKADERSKEADILDLVTSATLTGEYGLELINTKKKAKKNYSDIMQKVLDAAKFRDAAQYNYFVVMECEAIAQKGDAIDTEAIKTYLRKNFVTTKPGEATKMDERITGDSKSVSPYCGAFKRINTMKAYLRNRLMPFGHTDPVPDVKIADARRICNTILEKLQKQSTPELQKKEVQMHINAALAKNQPRASLIPTELFQRVLMPMYVKQLKDRTRKIWLAIVEADMVAELSDPIDKAVYKDQTPVNIAHSRNMQIFSTSESGSTFEEAVEYALGLCWVFHQSAVKKTKGGQ